MFDSREGTEADLKAAISKVPAHMQSDDIIAVIGSKHHKVGNTKFRTTVVLTSHPSPAEAYDALAKLVFDKCTRMDFLRRNQIKLRLKYGRT